MKIVRRAHDVLVLQSHTVEQQSLVASRVAICIVWSAIGVGAAWLTTYSDGWMRLDPFFGVAALCSVMIGVSLLGTIISDFVLTRRDFAFDRDAREILYVRKSLLRTSREVIGFDQVQKLSTFRARGRHEFSRMVTYMELAQDRRILVADALLGSSGEKGVIEIATAVGKMFALDPHLPEPEPDNSVKGWPAHVMNSAMCVAALAGGAVLGQYAADLWRAPAWPQVEGMVETMQVGKKMTAGKNPRLVDVIEISYRYTVAGNTYRGTRFNTRLNWLSPDEVVLALHSYSQGARCPVSYNPRDPAHSYLLTSFNLSRFVALCIAAIFCVLIGLAGLGYTFWKIVVPSRADPDLQLAA
ncbi:MAG TPA: DUF3592 domain-containing protein [Pirellulales bacterium]|nr:DUF3592 domain-containing protein [Pirellulales bacterium]